MTKTERAYKTSGAINATDHADRCAIGATLPTRTLCELGNDWRAEFVARLAATGKRLILSAPLCHIAKGDG